MAERRSPLAAQSARLAAVALDSGGRLVVAELPFQSQRTIRASPKSWPDAPGPGEVAVHDGASVLWLGPDEWLVVGTPEGVAGVRTGLGDVLLATVDVSANRTTLVLSGPAVWEVLAHGCALDLHPSVFGVDRCAQTMVAHAQVILWRCGPDEFRILVRPSFAGYLTEWLLDAAAELLLPPASR